MVAFRDRAVGQDSISLGEKDGVYQINKFSYRSDIDTTDGDALIIADNTTNTPTILTTASTFTIVYNGTTDGSGTTGALSLLVSYLDANEDKQDAVHALGSDGSDVTSFSGLGINRAVVLSSGSAEFNTNSITISATTGGSVQAFIAAESGVTEQLLIHVPRNTTPISKSLFLSAQKLAGGSAPRVTFNVYVYSRITSTRYDVFRYIMDTSVTNEVSLNDPTNFPFSPRDVIYITANTETNNTAVSARLSMNMYENT